MVKYIIIICALLSLCGCQRNVMVPSPPDPAPVIQAIADSNIPPDQKPDAIERAMRVMRDMYDAELRRASEMGTHVKVGWDEFLKSAIYVGGIIWATK